MPGKESQLLGEEEALVAAAATLVSQFKMREILSVCRLSIHLFGSLLLAGFFRGRQRDCHASRQVWYLAEQRKGG